MTVLATPRLRLRPLTTADADWWVRLHADEEVGRFVGTYTRQQALQRLRAVEQQWAERGHGLCAAEPASGGEPLGRTGLNWWPEFGETELGWAFARAHWGRGHATEAARAVLEWGFAELGLETVTSMIDPANTASLAVARRLGFSPYRVQRFRGRTLAVYAVHRRGRGEAP